MLPESCRIDGQSLTPLFENGTAEDWRDHLYLEMAAARATITKDWSYAAVRYTKEQIAVIQGAKPENLPGIGPGKVPFPLDQRPRALG